MTDALRAISGRYPDEEMEEITWRLRGGYDGRVYQLKRRDPQTMYELHALAKRVREAFQRGAQGVMLREGEIVWTWDECTVDRLRAQAESDGREDLARACAEFLSGRYLLGDHHRQAIWDALAERDGQVPS
jgi:hypothetical protein